MTPDNVRAVARASRWDTYCPAELPRLAQCDKVPCPYRERCIAAHEGVTMPAQAGTHPKGGDSLEAPAPLSDAVAKPCAQ